MLPRSAVRSVATPGECEAWVQKDAGLEVTFDDARRNGLAALFQSGTPFSVVAEGKDAAFVEVLVAPVDLAARLFIFITRDVTSPYSEMVRCVPARIDSPLQAALTDFFDNGSFALRWVGLDGRILRANQHELNMLGYPAEEYIGRNIVELYVDKSVAADYFKRLGDGKRLVDCEAELMHKDGTSRWLLMNSSVRYSRTGEFLHTRCFTQDITARKRLELDLQNAKLEAEAANAAKDQFLASLSHELRTPLTPVLMLLSLLRDDARLPADVREQLALMQRSTELEARLVDDLIDMTAIRNGRLQFTMHYTDLHALLAETRSILFIGDACENRVCRLNLAATRYIVRGDVARLLQVFRNILRNSIKFTPNGGQIEIATVNTADSVEIHFRDDGLGIDPAHIPSVFEPFRSALSPLSGLGLGLSISRAIVEAHRGRISAASEGAGRGMTISIRLPLSNGTASPDAAPLAPHNAFAAAAAAPRPLSPSAVTPEMTRLAKEARTEEAPVKRTRSVGAARRSLRVLVVEDNALCRAVFVRAVKDRLGHQVDEAVTLADALRLTQERSYDLIISDIGLPDGTGHDLMEALRRKGNGENLRAIAVTGFGREKDIDTSMRVGFKRHLTKPVSFHTLAQAISDVMDAA